MNSDYDTEVRTIARSLSEIAHALESADDAPERIQRALELVQGLVPYEQCALLEAWPGAEAVLHAVPMPSPAGRDKLLPVLFRLFRLVSEAEDIGRSSGGVPHLALPVMGLDHVIGVLRVVPSEETSYDAQHLRLLAVVAAQLGAFITMIRLREEDARRTRELATAHEFQHLLLGIVSHDLRNPLSVITTVASLLLKKTEDEQQARMIQRALRNAQKANRIINDLLDVTRSRVSGGIPVARQRVDVRALLKEIVDDVRLSHPLIELVAEASGSAFGEWDPDRLSQIATNLINNALLHGEVNTPVRVELRMADDKAVIAVHNDGSAIPDDLLPIIFDPFKQGAKRRVRTAGGGLGLGLYIVDQIARAHGGTTAVQSTAAEGTTFTVSLPRSRAIAAGLPPAAARERAADAEQSDSDGATGDAGLTAAKDKPLVMIVDDEYDIRVGIADILTYEGYAVVTAANGEEALQLLRTGTTPQLILLDLMMPVMDGETFCNVCHGDPELSSIPIFIISANAATAMRLALSRATGYLTKPVQLETLLQTVERVSH